MAEQTERVVLDITYEDAYQDPPSTWSWELSQNIKRLGIDSDDVRVELVTVFGRPATGRLDTSLRQDLAAARQSLGGMTTRAVTAEAEVERLRGYITDALDSPDDPGMARDFLRRALEGGGR